MKNNNLTSILLLSTLSCLVIGTSLITLVYRQEENATDTEKPIIKNPGKPKKELIKICRKPLKK
ncbi:MAG: hypothetical protein ACPKPY_07055 [Nitrososphaeraceae archaeon]